MSPFAECSQEKETSPSLAFLVRFGGHASFERNESRRGVVGSLNEIQAGIPRSVSIALPPPARILRRRVLG